MNKVAEPDLLQDPLQDRDSRLLLLRRMMVPIFSFAALATMLVCIILLGALAPSRTASFIEAGLTGCMIVTVLLFSMEVRLETPIMRFFAVLGFAWVCILFGMTTLDYMTR